VGDTIARLQDAHGAWSGSGDVVVEMVLRARRLGCPHCPFSTRARYDTRPMTSRWRHSDFGRWKMLLTACLRRLVCPEHGVCTEAVPFARPDARFTSEFEDLVAFVATKTDKSTIARLSRGWTGTLSDGSAIGWWPTAWTRDALPGWCTSGSTR